MLEYTNTGRAKNVFGVLSRWCPVFLQAAAIFFFSHQPSGSSVLESFPLSSMIGHFGGYGLLALLLYRAFTGGFGVWSTQAALRVLALAVLYGISDELHQAFVPGRQPSAGDLVVDGVGAAMALGAIWLYATRVRRLKRKSAHTGCLHEE